jgi:hypothetical protein
VEYFYYFISKVTKDERRTHPVFPWQKEAFASKLDLKLKNKLVKYYSWSIASCGVETWTLREVDQ